MEANRILFPQKTVLSAKKAAAPNQGAAAFFCSTETLPLYGNLRKFTISQQQGQTKENITFYNLLAEKHYFRLNRAETPFANVVLTEGKETAPFKFREVAA